MAQDNLAAYLNDHLAGSVVALELLAHLEQAHAGTPLAAILADVRAEIAADRAVLEQLITQLGVARSGPRQAMAWLGEKVAQLKLAFDDSGTGAMHLFESLEAVSLGIAGKSSLWRALEAAAAVAPALRAIDYPTLIRRADEQRTRIEAARLTIAPQALANAALSKAAAE